MSPCCFIHGALYESSCSGQYTISLFSILCLHMRLAELTSCKWPIRCEPVPTALSSEYDSCSKTPLERECVGWILCPVSARMQQHDIRCCAYVANAVPPGSSDGFRNVPRSCLAEVVIYGSACCKCTGTCSSVAFLNDAESRQVSGIFGQYRGNSWAEKMGVSLSLA